MTTAGDIRARYAVAEGTLHALWRACAGSEVGSAYDKAYWVRLHNQLSQRFADELRGIGDQGPLADHWNPPDAAEDVRGRYHEAEDIRARYRIAAGTLDSLWSACSDSRCDMKYWARLCEQMTQRFVDELRCIGDYRPLDLPPEDEHDREVRLQIEARVAEIVREALGCYETVGSIVTRLARVIATYEHNARCRKQELPVGRIWGDDSRGSLVTLGCSDVSLLQRG